MKNIFKSLMLVAVAAMAFTACEKDNNETNKAEQKTVINGVATIANDDTRSGFLPKEDGATAYASQWDGGEKIAIFYNGGNTDTTIDAEGNFSATLDGSVTSINVCSPYTAWYTTDVMDPSVLNSQTPRENSVDPAVHILQAKDVAVVDGVASAQMKHEVAYGKMTVNTPADFEIARVELTINGGTTYNLFATNVVDNVFWFAASEFSVSELIVKAYNANGDVYKKTVTPTAEKPLSFNKGKVSTFSVSNLEEEGELTVVSAVAGEHKVSGTVQSNHRLVTFTMSNGDTFGVAFNTDGKDFIAPGTWQTSDWQSSNYITGVYHNGTSVSIYTTLAVSYADDAYTIAPFSAYEWNVGYHDFIGYTGAIEGLTAPETGGDSGEGGDAGGDTGSDVTEINRFVINYLSLWNETEIKFFLDSDDQNVICIDIPGEIATGEYSIASGNIYKNYCYVQRTNGNEVLTDDIEMSIIVNGDGTYTFSGHVKTTTNTYIIEHTGTPTVG